MKQIIRLTESDLHRLVKESVYRILEGTDASASGDINRPVFPMMRRPSPVGEATDEEIKPVDASDAVDRKGGKNHSITVNGVNESINEFNWKAAALGGMMAMSPMQGNAQTQNYQQNKQDSIENSIRQRYAKTYTIKELVQICPQAYVDRNATPEVWKANAAQGKYYTSVNDNGDGKFRNNLVAYIAAKSGQNPWEALVKRFCPEQAGKTFKIGDF